MAMYEPQEVLSTRKLVLGPKKQTAYGTALLDASLTETVRFDAGDFPQLSKQYYQDGDKAGKGHNWATIHQAIQQDSALALNFDLDDFKAGWLGAFLFGAVQTSGVGPYTHLFTPITSTNLMPVTSLYFEDTADLQTKWIDMAIQDLEISGAAQGPLRAKASLIGSGKYTDGAMVSVPALQAAPVYLIGSDSDILLGAPGAAASIKQRIRSWSVKFSNELVLHRAPGGGLYASATKVFKQRASTQLVIGAKDVDDVRTLFTADTLQELQINTNSAAAAQLNIKFPGLYLTAAQLGVDGGEEVWSIESAQDAGVIKNGVNNYVEYTAINSVAAYLGAG